MSIITGGFIPEAQPRSVLSFKRNQVLVETVSDMEEIKAKELEMSLMDASIAFYLETQIGVKTRWKKIINEIRNTQHRVIADNLKDITGEKLHRVAGGLLISRGIET